MLLLLRALDSGSAVPTTPCRSTLSGPAGEPSLVHLHARSSNAGGLAGDRAGWSAALSRAALPAPVARRYRQVIIDRMCAFLPESARARVYPPSHIGVAQG